jgi:chitin disaccharide deacetylase
MATTAERLGHPADARVLIINGDDIGMCHAANVGTVAALREGVLTAASLMVPCPWALEAVRMIAGLDVGVHLTLTSEWQTYRWRSLTAAARDPANGLVDAEGYFWHRDAPVQEHGNPTVARAEAQAQVEWALARGMDVTNLDGHMGIFSSHPAYLAIQVDLARHYRLPARLRPAEVYREHGRSDLAEMVDAARADLLAPDRLAGLPLQNPEQLEGQMVEAIRALRPGVTEYILHAAAPGEELRAIAPDAAARVEAHRLVTESAAVRRAIQAEGITLIGYRELREAQRAGA